MMASTAVFIMFECVKSLIAHDSPLESSIFTIAVMGSTIVVKLIMWIVYRFIDHPLTVTLSEDHRNDVFTNAIGLFMYWGSSHLAWWLDACGGILLSLFVLVSWSLNTYQNAKMLLGGAAPPEVIQSITYIAMRHHPLIKEIEQVIAFQVGPEYFAELHIVIPSHVPLEVSHWIGETLQLKIEKISGIERAWVHVDCETHCDNEHLISMRATGKMA